MREKIHIGSRARRRYVIAIVSLSLAIVSLGIVTLSMYSSSEYYKNQLENDYQRAFFELTSTVSNMEIKLSKLMVMQSEKQIQKNLYDVSRQADNAQASLAQLPISHNTIDKTMKFVNQLGGLSESLAESVAKGNSLTSDQLNQIDDLYGVNKTISKELRAMLIKFSEQKVKIMPKNSQSTNKVDTVGDKFGELQNTSVDYPKMIFDGPFSDGVVNAEIKLTGKEIQESEAKEKLTQYLSDFKVNSIDYIDETKGKIATYNYNVVLKDESKLFAQISKIGGMLVLLDNDRELDNFSLEVEECIKIAEDFLKKIGYQNLVSVWVSDYNGNVYVNLASERRGIIYYPDLIKIIVARDNGAILGLETQTYLANHKERPPVATTISLNVAKAKISNKIKIDIQRLVVIPQEGNKEIAAYEFAGVWNEIKYFVYIDAKTGEEIEVFRVIDSEEGNYLA